MRSAAYRHHRRSVVAEARHLYQTGPALSRELHLVDNRRQRQRQSQHGARLTVGHAARRRAVGSSLRLPILENHLQVIAHRGDLVLPCASLRLECRLRNLRGRLQARLERLRLSRRRLLLRPQVALQLFAQRLDVLPVLLSLRRQRLPVSRLLERDSLDEPAHRRHLLDCLLLVFAGQRLHGPLILLRRRARHEGARERLESLVAPRDEEPRAARELRLPCLAQLAVCANAARLRRAAVRPRAAGIGDAPRLRHLDGARV